jgi:hypothetical protein
VQHLAGKVLVEVFEAHAVPNGRTTLNRGEVFADEPFGRFFPGAPRLVAVGDRVEFFEPFPKTALSNCAIGGREAAAVLAPLTLGAGPIPFASPVDGRHDVALRFDASRHATNCA